MDKKVQPLILIVERIRDMKNFGFLLDQHSLTSETKRSRHRGPSSSYKMGIETGCVRNVFTFFLIMNGVWTSPSIL